MKLKILGLGIAALAALSLQDIHCAARSVGAGVSVAAAVAVPVVVAQAASADDAKIKADVDAMIAGITNPLADAYYNGTFEELAKIIEASTDIKADVDATKDQEGKTIFDLAIAAKNWEVVDLFVRKGIAFKQEILAYLAEQGEFAVLRQLVERYRIVMSTQIAQSIMRFAAEAGNKEMIEYLLSKGLDINATSMGKTALMYAAEAGHAALIEVLLKVPGIDLEVVNRHADKNTWNMTALMYAIHSGSTESVACLLKAGANIRHETGRGNALMVAVESGTLEIVKLLVKAGADINAIGSVEITAIMIAACYGSKREIVEYLLSLPDIVLTRKDPIVPGRTLLMLAAKYRHKVVLTAFMQDLRIARTINAQDKQGRTALIEVVKTQLLETDHFHEQDYVFASGKDSVELLLCTPDIDVTIKDKSGKTALMWAQELAKHPYFAQTKHTAHKKELAEIIALLQVATEKLEKEKAAARGVPAVALKSKL